MQFKYLLLIILGLLFSCSDPKKKPQITYDDYIGYYKVGNPYQINSQWSFPEANPSFEEIGEASWYGDKFNGLQTANGDIFDKQALTAAHRTLPMPSMVRVTNKSNNRTIILMVNDRGPFAKDRVIDLSERAASILGYKDKGITSVKVEFLPGHTQKLWDDYNINAKLSDLVPNRVAANTSNIGQPVNTIANQIEVVNNNVEVVRGVNYSEIAQTDLMNLKPTKFDNVEGVNGKDGESKGSICLKDSNPVLENSNLNNANNLDNANIEYSYIIQSEDLDYNITDNSDFNKTSLVEDTYEQVVYVDIADVKRPDITISQTSFVNSNGEEILGEYQDQANKILSTSNNYSNDKANYIQIGSYGLSKNAYNIKDQLSQLGDIDIYPINLYKKILYRVRLGPLFGEQTTSLALNNIKDLGYKDAIIVTEN